MELTLKRLLEQAEFNDARKGYDRAEVDDFLDRAVAMATKVEAKLTETMDQSKASGAAAGPTAAEVEAEVERRVAVRLSEQPAPPPGPSEEEMAEEVRRTIVLAQRTADAAVREAREDAAKLLADANERAAGIDAQVASEAAAARAAVAAEVATERGEARERLAAEISELEGIREALRSDVTVLERHVEEQRNQLRSTVGELQRLLDDPGGFRMAPTPALLDPVLPGADPAPGSPAASPPAAEVPAPVEPEVAVEAPADPPVFDAAVAADPVDDSSAPDPDVGPDDPADSLDFSDVDHEAPGVAPLDSGPPTAPVSAVDLGLPPQDLARHPADEDAFLSELRKAMADEEPLGPREQTQQDTADFYGDDDDDRRGWRFGKRR